jgi:hypothetical protein
MRIVEGEQKPNIDILFATRFPRPVLIFGDD